MRVRRTLAALPLCLAWVVALGWLPGGSAGAADLSGWGWWWRAQAGLLGTEVPPPPNVPEDGLAVGAGPDGAVAVAAVRYELPDGESAQSLTLTVAEGGDIGGEQATVAACPPAVRWASAQAGRWDMRPEANCDTASVQGIRSDDGATWTFPVAPLVADGVVDVVLVPGAETPDGNPSPGFQLAFEAPAADSLAVTGSSTTQPITTATTPPSSGGGGGGTFPSSGGFSAPTIPPVETFTPAEGGDTGAAGQAFETAAAPLDPESDEGRALGVLLLAGTAVVGVLSGRQPARAPRLLGNVTSSSSSRPSAPTAEPSVGGLGRFSRPRTGSPPRLM
ncbi:MAG TPA: hypothetical protein VM618_03140 [Acidimicrobiia bacterium]|nr:hypothetical protein [Acidimicrobiia bacterium]